MLKKLTLSFVLFFAFNCFAQQIVDWESTEFTDYYLYTAEFDSGKEFRAASDDLSPQKLFVNFIAFDPAAIVILSFMGGTNVKLNNNSVSSSSVHIVTLPHEISFDTVSLKYSYILAGVTLYETETLSFGMIGVSELEILNEIDVYPNPSSDGNVKMTIPQISNLNSSKLEVLVFGADSRKVDAGISLTNDGSIQLNLSNQPAGLYIVVIKMEDQIFRTKIIKG